MMILKDRDISSGKSNNENDRQIYLNTNPVHFRIIKRWEIENYLFDKEVLKAYCNANTLVFDETEYDNFVKDIVNDNIKDEINRIKNICGINISINQEKFKINLSEFITEDMVVYKEIEQCIFYRQ